MNDESLRRANAILAAVAARVSVGETFRGAPGALGREVGVLDPLAAARAVRALLVRSRLQAVPDGYVLRDATPIAPGEKGVIVRRPRGATAGARRAPAVAPPEGASFEDVGRDAISRLVDLGAEVAALRTDLREAREEVRGARAARDDAERRAETMTERVRQLEARAEMAEANLRTLLATARTTDRETTVQSSEMEAILGVLKGERDAGAGA